MTEFSTSVANLSCKFLCTAPAVDDIAATDPDKDDDGNELLASDSDTTEEPWFVVYDTSIACPGNAH